MSAYDSVMQKQAANFVPLTPLGFLERAAQVHPDRVSMIHGDTQYTWKETYARCRQLAHALVKRGIGRQDTVAIIAPNIPAHIEFFFGVPMAGAVANALNTRLDAPMLAFMLKHSETKLIFVDRVHSKTIAEALKMLEKKPIVIDIDDPFYTGEGDLIGEMDYEAFLATGDAGYAWEGPADEWDPIALNYTSGTTGDPKGAVYHHRGAYLKAINNSLNWDMGRHPVYLWTVPAFHCSGWCYPWTVTLMAGTHVCLRQVRAKDIYDLIVKHGVTHLCAAPVVISTLLNAPANEKKSFGGRTVEVMTGGSAPPAAVLQAMSDLGFHATHIYGATESYGPAMVCEWHSEWNDLPHAEQANLKARQGVRSPALEGMMIANPETMEEVPWDGQTIGECMMRGNIIMAGYLKNPKTTDETLRGGWYHTGDLCVRHPNGYIEVKDRLKDIIISGGENIPTLEIENALYRHPAVLGAAVVAKPCDKWGETPCAFVELKPGAKATEAEIIAHCRENMAHYKAPKSVVFGVIERTPTGKIQKFELRKRAKAIAEAEKKAAVGKAA